MLRLGKVTDRLFLSKFASEIKSLLHWRNMIWFWVDSGSISGNPEVSFPGMFEMLLPKDAIEDLHDRYILLLLISLISSARL